MDKAEFMDVLFENGFKPINENGCIMIVTPNKDDHELMVALAEKCGYVGRGSYGWRHTRKEKEIKEDQNYDVHEG